MDDKPISQPTSREKDTLRRAWRKAYAELLAVGRIVRLYPKSTLLCPLLLLSLILAIGVWGITYVARSEHRSAQDRAAILAYDAAGWVKQTIDNAITPIMLTAAMVQYNPRLSAVRSLFLGMAPAMLAQAPPNSIRVLQLVPHGVVNATYPLPGNEGSVGLDVIASAAQREGAVQAVVDRTLTLVGPINFVQGGRGVVVRKPVFVANVSAEEDFDIPWPINAACGSPCAYNATTRTALWGFISALVNQEALTDGNHSKLVMLENLGYLYELRTIGDHGVGSQRVAASAKLPRDPVEVRIELPNAEWVIGVSPDHGWPAKWYAGLLAGVVVLALATSLLLFAVLVTWRRHQMLLEALLPKQILDDLVNEDPASPLYACPKIRQAETPADVLLNMMGDLLEGYPPRLPDVVFIRTALLRNLDLYTPLDVRGQIKAAELDSEVAQALMQQLVGGRRTSMSSWRQLTLPRGPASGTGAGAGNGHDPAAAAAAGGGPLKGGSQLTSATYDFETLSGALAFVLSPEAALQGNAAAAAGGGGGGGGGPPGVGEKGMVPYLPAASAAASASANILTPGISCPLLVRGAPLLAVQATCTAAPPPPPPSAPLADAPQPEDCGVGGEGEAEGEDGGAVGVGAAGAGEATATVLAAAAAAVAPGAGATRRVLPGGTQSNTRLVSCAHSSPGFSPLLVRSSAGCEEAAARAAPRVQSPTRNQQPSPLAWSYNGGHRRRPSLVVAGGAGGGGVCAACGAPISPAPAHTDVLPVVVLPTQLTSTAVPPPPPPPPSAVAAPAAAGDKPPPNWATASVTGGSATRLMAVARRLRVGGGGGGQCAGNGGASVGGPAGANSVGLPSVGSVGSVSLSGALVVNGSGGGGAKPNSRLAVALSPRGEGPLSQPVPVFTLRPPSSPKAFCGTGAAAQTPPSPGRQQQQQQLLLPLVPAGGGEREEVGLRIGSDASLVPAGVITPVVGATSSGGEEEEEAAAPAGGHSSGPPPAPLVQEVERVLATADAWHFDAWALRDCSGGHALSALGFYLVQRQGLMTPFNIKPVALARLLRRLETGYVDNPYHNATHAADVLQTLHVLLHATQLTVHYLDPLGLLAAYFAAIIHDLGHPGLTGDFLIATSDALALRYNDRSPLENHHCAAAFELLHNDPDLDITAGMSQSEKTMFRKQVIELVLATDMKQHFSTLSHFNTVHRLAAFSHSQHPHPHTHTHTHQHTSPAGGEAVGAGGSSASAGAGAASGSSPAPPAGSGATRVLSANSRAAHPAVGGGGGGGGLTATTSGGTTGNGHLNSNGTSSGPSQLELVVVALEPAGSGGPDARPAPRPLDETERTLSLQLALKCADIGNLGRELECYKRWVDVLEEEFFRQGDRERQLGLPISPLSDRTKQGVSKSQTGFFDFVALPLVHAMAAAFPGAQPLLRSFLSNYHYWKRADLAASHDSINSAALQQQQSSQQQQQPPAMAQQHSSKQSSPVISVRDSLSLSRPLAAVPSSAT